MNRKVLLAGVACFCVSALATVGLAKHAKNTNPDHRFMKMAAETNMTEAHIGQMAENQAASQAVKDFGAMLVKDHTQAYSALSVLGAKTGIQIPKGINAAKITEITQLKPLKGKQFDRKFALDQVQSHSRVIAAFKQEAAHGQNADIKSYATKMLPGLQEHLRRAEQLEKTVKHS